MHRSNLTRSERWLERGLGTVVLLALALGLAADVRAQGVLNLYSARHYQTDEALYENFTRQTGIKINRIELGDEPLIQRLRNEGTTPGSVFPAAPAPFSSTLPRSRLRTWIPTPNWQTRRTRARCVRARVRIRTCCR